MPLGHRHPRVTQTAGMIQVLGLGSARGRGPGLGRGRTACHSVGRSSRPDSLTTDVFEQRHVRRSMTSDVGRAAMAADKRRCASGENMCLLKYG